MILPNGYKMTTTFFQDFSIAEKFGQKVIIDTFDCAFNEWKSNYIYLTELVIVLNWKIWIWYEKKGSCEESKLYNELWMKADNYAMNNLNGEEMDFFLRITD